MSNQTRCCYCGMPIDKNTSPRMYQVVTREVGKNKAVKSLRSAGYAHRDTCSVWMSRQRDFGGWLSPVERIGPEPAILPS